jgi:hypothetical protein
VIHDKTASDFIDGYEGNRSSNGRLSLPIVKSARIRPQFYGGPMAWPGRS